MVLADAADILCAFMEIGEVLAVSAASIVPPLRLQGLSPMIWSQAL